MAHSEHGFSAQSKGIACGGSFRMQRGIPNTSNPASELGTAVHEMGEMGLTYDLDTTQIFKGQKFNGIKVTQKMIDAADYYLHCVAEIMRERPDATMLIETKVKMSSIDPERLWGTADLAVIDYFNRHLIMGDYKNGYGIVEVMPNQYVHATGEYIEGNAQLMGYLIALCDTLDLWNAIDTFEIMIVQPNKGHIDGECRRVAITREHIAKWWEVYRVSHELAIRPDAPVNPGVWCQWCRARSICSANINQMVDILRFDGEKIDNDRLIRMVDMADVIRNTLKHAEETLVEEARKGLQVPGKKLVRTIVRAKCEDEDAFVSEAMAAGKSRADLFNEKLKSKTDLKAIVGDEMAHKYFKTPERGYTLVEKSDTRVAVMPDRQASAAGKFQKVIK